MSHCPVADDRRSREGYSLVFERIDPSNDADGAARHVFVTDLQILTLTAELLALDLRSGNYSSEQLQARSLALSEAGCSVRDSAGQLSASMHGHRGDRRPLADTEPVRLIGAFVGFIVQHAARPDVERAVLAEYVDRLHQEGLDLIASMDQPSELWH